MLDTTDVENIISIGLNPGHDMNLNTLKNLNRRKRYKFSKVLKDLTRNRNFGINVAKNLFPTRKLKKNPNDTNDRPISKGTTQNKVSDKDTVPNLAWID